MFLTKFQMTSTLLSLQSKMGIILIHLAMVKQIIIFNMRVISFFDLIFFFHFFVNLFSKNIECSKIIAKKKRWSAVWLFSCFFDLRVEFWGCVINWVINSSLSCWLSILWALLFSKVTFSANRLVWLFSSNEFDLLWIDCS